MFQAKVVEEIKISMYDRMWKNVVEPRRLQMTIQYGACALSVG
jgi:hypothetical protein